MTATNPITQQIEENTEAGTLSIPEIAPLPAVPIAPSELPAATPTPQTPTPTFDRVQPPSLDTARPIAPLDLNEQTVQLAPQLVESVDARVSTQLGDVPRAVLPNPGLSPIDPDVLYRPLNTSPPRPLQSTNLSDYSAQIRQTSSGDWSARMLEMLNSHNGINIDSQFRAPRSFFQQAGDFLSPESQAGKDRRWGLLGALGGTIDWLATSLGMDAPFNEQLGWNFGDFGNGALGALLYAVGAPQNLLFGGGLDVASTWQSVARATMETPLDLSDFVQSYDRYSAMFRGDTDPTPYILRGIRGDDLGFSNYSRMRDGRVNRLGIVGDEAAPQQLGQLAQNVGAIDAALSSREYQSFYSENTTYDATPTLDVAQLGRLALGVVLDVVVDPGALILGGRRLLRGAQRTQEVAQSALAARNAARANILLWQSEAGTLPAIPDPWRTPRSPVVVTFPEGASSSFSRLPDPWQTIEQVPDPWGTPPTRPSAIESAGTETVFPPLPNPWALESSLAPVARPAPFNRVGTVPTPVPSQLPTSEELFRLFDVRYSPVEIANSVSRSPVARPINPSQLDVTTRTPQELSRVLNTIAPLADDLTTYDSVRTVAALIESSEIADVALRATGVVGSRVPARPATEILDRAAAIVRSESLQARRPPSRAAVDQALKTAEGGSEIVESFPIVVPRRAALPVEVLGSEKAYRAQGDALGIPSSSTMPIQELFALRTASDAGIPLDRVVLFKSDKALARVTDAVDVAVEGIRRVDPLIPATKYPEIDVVRLRDLAGRKLTKPSLERIDGIKEALQQSNPVRAAQLLKEVLEPSVLRSPDLYREVAATLPRSLKILDSTPSPRILELTDRFLESTRRHSNTTQLLRSFQGDAHAVTEQFQPFTEGYLNAGTLYKQGGDSVTKATLSANSEFAFLEAMRSSGVTPKPGALGVSGDSFSMQYVEGAHLVGKNGNLNLHPENLDTVQLSDILGRTIDNGWIHFNLLDSVKRKPDGSYVLSDNLQQTQRISSILGRTPTPDEIADIRFVEQSLLDRRIRDLSESFDESLMELGNRVIPTDSPPLSSTLQTLRDYNSAPFSNENARRLAGQIRYGLEQSSTTARSEASASLQSLDRSRRILEEAVEAERSNRRIVEMARVSTAQKRRDVELSRNPGTCL